MQAEVAARAAAREAEQRAKEQTSEASQLQYRDQETAHSAGADDSRPTGSGRLPGPPPGQGRNAGPPPSGSGRGQGRGASLDAANGRLSLPPGIEPGRDDHGGRGGRGRRGRVSLASCTIDQRPRETYASLVLSRIPPTLMKLLTLRSSTCGTSVCCHHSNTQQCCMPLLQDAGVCCTSR